MKSKKLYNIIFPVWLLIWFPSWLWLFLIPLNFLVDFTVLAFCRKKLNITEKGFLAKNSWKTCLIGFVSDLAGTAFLTVVLMLLGLFGSTASTDNMDNLAQALIWNCFSSLPALFIVIFAVALSGLLIYTLNHKLYEKQLGEEKAHYIALRMAIITAPYLFFIPVALLY